jgi:hypothetical protein
MEGCSVFEMLCDPGSSVGLVAIHVQENIKAFVRHNQCEDTIENILCYYACSQRNQYKCTSKYFLNV